MELISKFPQEYKIQLDMYLEEKRLATFKKWVFDDDAPCSAQKLAEAGFYSVATKEDPDAVQCFLCSKTLDGWEADDNPWTEHLSHAKQCTFAKMQLPEEALTLPQFADLRNEQMANIVNKYFDELDAAELDKLEVFDSGK